MIQIVMKPEKAPVVNHEGLYSVRMNGEHLMHIRALNAAHAENKLTFCFRRELSGKTLDFDLRAAMKTKEDSENENDTETTDAGAASE